MGGATGAWRGAIVLFVLLAVATGCGDDEPDRLSVEEFEERGNEICLEYQDRVADAISGLGPGQPTAEEAQRVMIDAVLPAHRDQLEALLQLDAPEDLARDFDEFLSDTDDAISTMTEWAEEDPARLLEDDPFPEFDDQAAAFGLAACGSGGGGQGPPSVEAIADSLDGTEFAADLSEDEVRCFAQAMRDGDLSATALRKLVDNNVNLSESELDDFHPAARRAATACGFTYLAP